MKLITETTEDFNVLITEEKESKKKTYHIEGIFMQGNVSNRNKRLYPSEVLFKEMRRYNENYVAKNRAYGELGHPQGPTINLDRVSHIITELRKDGSNVVGRAKILGTNAGQTVKRLLDDGCQLAVSTRGMGSVKLREDGINEVQGDFMLATAADIVADPSAPDAFVNGIMEGVEFYLDSDRNQWIIETTQDQINREVRAHALTEEKKLQIFEDFIRRITIS